MTSPIRLACTIRLKFAARGEQPALDLFWYDGGMQPRLPADLESQSIELAREGILFVGDAGVILAGFLGQDPQLFSQRKREPLWKEGVPTPATGAGRSKAGQRHNPWVAAVRGGEPSPGSFLNAGPITDAVNLGSVCIASGEEGRVR